MNIKQLLNLPPDLQVVVTIADLREFATSIAGLRESTTSIADPLDDRLVDLRISTRALNGMLGLGLTTVRDLLSVHKTDLLKSRSIGKKTLAEIDKFIIENGYQWGQEIQYQNK